MAVEIVRRARNYTIERDPAWKPGRHRATYTLHDQWYQDESNQWQAVDENLVNSDLPSFAHMAKAMAHAIYAKTDGTRRWYPRRNVSTEYVEFGRPQYWTGSAWADLPLNAPTRAGSTILWDQTNFSLRVEVNWHRVKLDVVLKTAAAARRIRWPVSLTGLTWNNWRVLSEAEVVGVVYRPTGADANGVPIAVSTSYAGGYVEFTADFTGAVYPVTIDPTMTLQPQGTVGKDCYLYSTQPTWNSGISDHLETRPAAMSSLLEFDLSVRHPSDVCVSATLYMTVNYLDAGGSRTVNVYSVAQANEDWVEGTKNEAVAAVGESTWDWKRYATVAWPGSAGCQTSGTDYESSLLGTFTVVDSAPVGTEYSTALTASRVEDWFGPSNTNYGLVLIGITGTNNFLASSDHATAAYRPKLVVEYTTTLAFPTFKASGVYVYGTGALSVPLPTAPNAPVAGDIAIVVVESENQAISLSFAAGFVELGAQANKAAGTGGVNPASRIAVYWKRCVGSDGDPTVAAPGDHATAQSYLFSGCKASENPWNVYAEGNDGGANDLTGVIPGATTTVDACLLVLICSTSYNSSSTTEFNNWANAGLESITERADNCRTTGLGGGHGMATGERANAGAYGNTTVDLAHTSYKGAMSIALEPIVTGATVNLAKVILAGSGKLLDVQPGAITKTMDALVLAGSPKLLDVTGAISLMMDALTLLGAPKAATVTPGAVTKVMDALLLIGSPKLLDVQPGAVSLAMGALALTSSVPDAAVVAVVTLALDALILSGAAKTLDVTPGAVAVVMDALTLLAAAKVLDVQQPGAPATLDMQTLILGGAAPILDVQPGVVALVLNAVSLASVALGLDVGPGAVALLMDALTLLSTPFGLDVIPGAATLALHALTLLSAAETATVTPGAVARAMDALSLIGAAGTLDVQPGVVALAMQALSLLGSALGLDVQTGAVALAMQALALVGETPTLSVMIGGMIALDRLILSGSARALDVSPGAVALVLDALTLAGAVKGLDVQPGTVALALDALAMVSVARVAMIMPGGVSLLLDALAIIAATPGMDVSPGAVAIALSALPLSGSARTLALLLGEVSVQLDALVLAAAAGQATISNLTGLYIWMGVAHLASLAPTVDVVNRYLAHIDISEMLVNRVTLSELQVGGVTLSELQLYVVVIEDKLAGGDG